MRAQLLDALVRSGNEAADDLLLEGLRLGSESEQQEIIDTLRKRNTVRGLSGAINQFENLPEPVQLDILHHVKSLHTALRECGRSDRPELRLAAMKIIALSRQGKLGYVLSENLHEADESLSKAAAEAMVALARWVATESRRLQKGIGGAVPGSAAISGAGAQSSADEISDPAETAAVHHELLRELTDADPKTPVSSSENAPADQAAIYQELMAQRGEIESAVARAMDVHRGRHTPELLRAALLLCDWPQSKTLAILQTTKHGGQAPMVRRLQAPPASEHVEAFLLGGSHGGLRMHFGTVFAHIEEAPVLDALLRKTHWLKDFQLQLCMRQVVRGAWWGEAELIRDLERHDPDDAAKIGEWLAVSGMHDVVQDERMALILARTTQRFAPRLRLLRLAAGRKRGASVQLLRMMLADPDERLMRMAAREIIRRRPIDFENMLLQLMTGAPESVRRVVSRAIGQVGFENFWQRFDRMDRSTRRQAGRAMLKILPDAVARLGRRLSSGPNEQRIKALQITQELGLAEPLRETLVSLSSHPHPRVRSKAVSVLGELKEALPEAVMERVLNDTDARVRANAIEVVDESKQTDFIPLLAQRIRSTNNRERANAIKALHHMKVGVAGPQLISMLQDPRPEHRISALWAMKQIGFWRLLTEVGKLAKEDENMRVRRYALGVLKSVADLFGASREEAG